MDETELTRMPYIRAVCSLTDRRTDGRCNMPLVAARTAAFTDVTTRRRRAITLPAH